MTHPSVTHCGARSPSGSLLHANHPKCCTTGIGFTVSSLSRHRWSSVLGSDRQMEHIHRELGGNYLGKVPAGVFYSLPACLPFRQCKFSKSVSRCCEPRSSIPWVFEVRSMSPIFVGKGRFDSTLRFNQGRYISDSKGARKRPSRTPRHPRPQGRKTVYGFTVMLFTTPS